MRANIYIYIHKRTQIYMHTNVYIIYNCIRICYLFFMKPVWHSVCAGKKKNATVKPASLLARSIININNVWIRYDLNILDALIMYGY